MLEQPMLVDCIVEPQPCDSRVCRTICQKPSTLAHMCSGGHRTPLDKHWRCRRGNSETSLTHWTAPPLCQLRDT